MPSGILVTVVGVLLLGTAGRPSSGVHPTAGAACALEAGCGYGLYPRTGARLLAHGDPSRAAIGAIFTLVLTALIERRTAHSPVPSPAI